MKTQMTALMAIAAILLSCNAFAHDCDTTLTSHPEGTRSFQAIQSYYLSTRIPVVVERRSNGSKFLDTKISARFYALKDWTAMDVAGLIRTIVNEARPDTEFQSIRTEDIREHRPIRKGELVSVVIHVNEPAGRGVFQVNVIGYNAEDVPLFSADQLIY